MKYIKNLENQTQSVLAEDIANDAAEISGLDKDAVSDAIKGLNFSNYLELGNAVSVEDGETIREILNISDVVPENEVDLEEEQGDLGLEDHVDMRDQRCRECGKGEYIETSIHDDWDGVLHCSECGSATKRHMRQFSDGSLTEGSGDFGFLSPEEMQGLTTPRLLAYYKAKRKENKQSQVSTFYDGDGAYTQELELVLQVAKNILDSREHLGEDIFDEEKLLDKPTLSLKDLAKKHDRSLADMGSQLAKGIKVEKEHTSDMLVAKEIALDHLSELPDYYDRLQKMEEADNPSAPAAASPAQQAVTPPSAGSTINALAQPADTATDVDDQEVQQGRKEVDDLQIGDEIEVADIDGQPAAGRVRNLAGPGDTLVITGKGNEEHMIRKDSILSTPMIPVQERLQKQYESALSEKGRQTRLKKTNIGAKHKRAERFEKKRKLDVDEGYGEETYDEMVEYWKQSLSSSIVRKGKFEEMYAAAGRDIEVLNAAIEEEAHSIAETYHGSGEGIGSSDQNHFLASVARNLGIEDLFGWNKPKDPHPKDANWPHASDEEMERDKANRGSRFKNLGESEDFHFFVDPQAQGANVMNSDGDIHDYYEDEAEARKVAAQLNAQYGKVDEDVARMRKLAGLQETASGGATGAGAIASSPAAMNGVQKRNPSIYGQTKLKKKPTPKKRPTKEDTSAGIGRSKK